MDESTKERKRQQYMKESLKTYTLIKKNIFLDRKRRQPTEDDTYVCECNRAKPEDVP
jgi:hypothetical protein